ncbi:hypothetical protein MNBD_ALPHA06-1301 [hydrothermal vent metagenome]|uniref:RNA polymerase sigma factor n=1 Tax=hydrothermal vent metagenome TaxID=652676 RepID=A0A3B0RYX2_9ZZZZ
MLGKAPAKSAVDDPDQPLVRRIAQGDEHAAAILMDRHLPSILGLACNMLGDVVEAEDVAQEAFLKAWLHAGKWQPGKAKFATWLHRVSINLCYDKLRKRREIYMDVLPERMDEQNLDAEMQVGGTELAKSVRAAISTLAPRQRAAISLCHLQEMGNIEAAKVMEISVEALESLLGRGRRKLREILQNQITELRG